MPLTSLEITAGPAAGSSISVGSEPLVIGRRADGEGRLGDDSELSREHARLTESGGRLLIEDLGSRNGTFVNGRQISQPTELSDGDTVSLGATTFTVKRSLPVRRPRIRVLAGAAKGAEFELAPGGLLIGREAEGEGRLEGDRELSRRHARIYEEGGRVLVQDLGSTNGTFVNNRRIGGPTALEPRDSIEVGTTTLTVDGLEPSADDESMAPGLEVTAARPVAGPQVTAPRHVPEAPVGEPGGADLWLRVVAGRATGTSIPLTAEGFTFGRAQAGPGALGGDPELSRDHARLSRSNGNLLLEDLGSTNGTFVNGRRISGATEVEPGDAIWAGSTTLLIASPEQPEPDVLPAEPPTPSPETGFLARFAAFSDRNPKRVLGAVAIFFVVAVVVGAPVAGLFAAEDPFTDPGAESVEVSERIAEATGEEPDPQVLALVTSSRTVDSPAVRRRVREVGRTLRENDQVSRVVTFYSSGNEALVSRDRRQTYAAAFFKAGEEADLEEAALDLVEEFEGQEDVKVGGSAVSGAQIGEQAGEDIGKAEGMAFPILFALSIFVFRGLVAALMPMFVGALTVFTTFFVLRFINEIVPMSEFALNIVIALGLGLSIDYSLFVVSRYREELAKVGQGRGESGAYGAIAREEGRGEFAGSEQEALTRAIFTAGRTVLYSAVTVAIALATLCVFPQPFLYSMGIGGAVCALVAVTVSLVALPALLSLLGPRINSLAPRRWKEQALRTARQEREGPWYRLSQAVMRRPGVVAAVSAAVLLLMGLPALGIKFTGVDASSIPTHLSSRQVDDAIDGNFPLNPTEAITVLLEDAPRNRAQQVRTVATELRALPGAKPDTGEPPRPLDGNLWAFSVFPAGETLDDRTLDLVETIRSRDRPFPTSAGGETASFIDQKDKIVSLLPVVAVLLCVLTAIVLFLMTGSVILPIKSLVMNVLSLSAAFGLLVLIFQDGRFEGLLGYDSQGAIELSQPVLLFAVAFGLATDYAVFLLTRIKEARVAGADNRDSVAIGLERTGRIVTQAALLFCVAIGAFATSSIIFIKEVGIGTALAVIIDATIIRAFLVPSLMALLGDRNWWAPAPLRKLHNKIGLSEG
ncbi:MAG TPA: MMPL family transporter [Thermoleophilaceae bacterium]|nr:MMPL family transporter [Thermoleophilaceae bacterium]